MCQKMLITTICKKLSRRTTCYNDDLKDNLQNLQVTHSQRQFAKILSITTVGPKILSGEGICKIWQKIVQNNNE